MPLHLLCDEHIPFPVVQGLRRRGINVTTVQEIGLRSTTDIVILTTVQQQQRVLYTRDADFLRHHHAGVSHAGILYHHPLAYGIGEAIRRVPWPVKPIPWRRW
jgi:hypothetical protein